MMKKLSEDWTFKLLLLQRNAYGMFPNYLYLKITKIKICLDMSVKAALSRQWFQRFFNIWLSFIFEIFAKKNWYYIYTLMIIRW